MSTLFHSIRYEWLGGNPITLIGSDKRERSQTFLMSRN
jgi:hypothetical protein